MQWEKPEEYALYDKESQKQHEQDGHSLLQPQLSLSSSQEVSQKQQVLSYFYHYKNMVLLQYQLVSN